MEPLTFNTPEELTAYLRSKDGNAVLSAAMGQDYVTAASISGLVQNKENILAEKKKVQAELEEMKKKYEELEKTVDSFDIDEYTRLKNDEQQRLSQTSSENQGSAQINNLKLIHENEKKSLARDIEKLQKQADEKDKEYRSLEKDYHTVLIDNALNKEIDQANIVEEHKDMLFNAFRGRARAVKSAAGEISVVMMEAEGQLPITDFFKSWTESDKAKIYIKAPENTGGGSSPTGTGTFKGLTLADLQKKYTELKKAGQMKEAIAVNREIKRLTAH